MVDRVGSSCSEGEHLLRLVQAELVPGGHGHLVECGFLQPSELVPALADLSLLRLGLQLEHSPLLCSQLAETENKALDWRPALDCPLQEVGVFGQTLSGT